MMDRGSSVGATSCGAGVGSGVGVALPGLIAAGAVGPVGAGSSGGAGVRAGSGVGRAAGKDGLATGLIIVVVMLAVVAVGAGVTESDGPWIVARPINALRTRLKTNA